MVENNVEFKLLDVKCTGNDTVVFRLEDGALVKIKVDIQRAGVAVGITNPDGTPHYDIGTALKVTLIPAKKSYFVPRSKLQVAPLKDPREMPFIR
jgi:hypothetical protein